MNNMRADDVTKKLDLSDDISSSVPLISSSSNPGAAKLCCISGNKSHQDSTIQQQTDGGNWRSLFEFFRNFKSVDHSESFTFLGYRVF